MKKTKIIIADDSKEYLQGVKALISLAENYEIIATYLDGSELANSTDLNQADIVLSDIQMPKLSGIEAARLINHEYPNLKMIALTMHKDSVYLTDMISAGFRGFVYKPDTAMKLLNVIEQVLNNEFVFPRNLEL